MNTKYGTKTKTLSVILSLLMIAGVMTVETGCNGQSTAVALLTAAGPAVAAVVNAISPNNAVLAGKIQTDFAAAAAAVQAYKAGTPCQNVISVLNIVVSDLNLVPKASQYATLIALAATAVEAILAVFPACQALGATKGGTQKVGNPSVSYGDFKKQWNAEVAKHPELGANAKIK